MKRILFAFLLTFIGFIIYFTCRDESKQRTIGIQPLGKIDIKYLKEIKSQLESTYSSRVIIYNQKSIPPSTFINIKSPRYRADKLLDYLEDIKPDSISKLIGVIEKDISFTKRNSLGLIKEPVSKYYDFGIFGLGRLNGDACIVSMHRLKHSNTSIFLNRVKKIAVHEIGHTIGLEHCATEKCVMNDANESISTIDRAGFELCGMCKRRI